MNRAARRALEAENRKWHRTLRPIHKSLWPQDGDDKRKEVWRSRDWLVQVFTEPPGLRISVNRTAMRHDGRWVDGITWDELQDIKASIGRGDRWAVEIYPPDRHVVNDANMRHLWVLPKQPEFGWRNRG